jgi:hypothetical protein
VGVGVWGGGGGGGGGGPGVFWVADSKEGEACRWNG